MTNKNKNETPSNAGLSFGYTIIGEFVFCFFVGFYVDQKLNSGYVWTLTGMGLGMVLIAYELWKLTRKN